MFVFFYARRMGGGYNAYMRMGIQRTETGTPTALPPPPRAVRGGDGCGIWFVRIFILPHCLVGIWMPCECALLILAAMFYTTVDGKVTGAEVYHSAKSGRDSYTLK